MQKSFCTMLLTLLVSWSSIYCQEYNPNFYVQLLGLKKAQVQEQLLSLKAFIDAAPDKVSSTGKDSVIGFYTVDCKFYDIIKPKLLLSGCQTVTIEFTATDSILIDFDKLVDAHKSFGSPKLYRRLQVKYASKAEELQALKSGLEQPIASWRKPSMKPTKNLEEILVIVNRDKTPGLYRLKAEYTRK